MAKMTAAEARDAARGLTFEDVWAVIMKGEEKMDRMKEESRQAHEATKIWREEMKQMREEAKERDAAWKKEMKQLRKDQGRLSHSYGEQTEAMFVNLYKILKPLGYTFDRQFKSGKFVDRKNNKVAEADHILENGDLIMFVEIKAKLSVEDVKDHIARLKRVSGVLAGKNDKRKVVGAVGGGIVSESVKSYAQKRGLFVFEQNGKAVSIADRPEGFELAAW